MKKIYLFLYLLLISSAAQAQTASAYGFTAFTAPYTSISATGTSTVALGTDDATLPGIPIGFTFTFCGVDYTTLSASSNGWLSLANTISIEYNNLAVSIPSAGFLAAYWDDLSGQISATAPAIPAYYSTTGLAPNRVFTFEWKNWSPYNYTGSIASGLASFQIKLYETTNIIDFCYGPSTFASLGATIGIANSTTDWQTLNNVSASPTPSSSTFTTSLSTSPANNQVYRWSICTPPPIVGTTTVCVGSTSSLSDPATGGTWVSASPGIATMGLTSGVLTGVATGTATISYTSMPGCVRTTVVTVNSAPPAITGALSVCTGSTTTLTNIFPGGTWTSSSTSVATVGVSTGVVSGISAGTSIITYAATSGCTTTAIVTVNAVPPTITGTLNLCIGSSTTLSNIVAGGAWTSGNPAVATVVSGTGVVTGVSIGTSTISYTVSGCTRTTIVTVSAAPSVIGGTATVCVASTTTLTNTVSGGAWTTSAPGTAIVTAGTGIVTGISPGTAIITYTTGAGCFATREVTVNAAPSAITGTLVVCAGLTTTLSDATTGGTWSSAAPTVATVGATTGIVTGVIAGTAIISYTSALGCAATTIVTVNLSPAALTGTAVVCEGATTTLASTTIAGLWSSSNTAVATVGVISGVVTGVSAGTATISYTLSTGCYAARTVSVNASPAAIGGTLSVCQGLTSSLTDATAGGTWSSSTTGVATVGATTGVVSGITAGTSVITYALTATGCFATAIFTVNPLPASISGIPSVCVGLTTSLADLSAGGTWSSSATGIATVDAVGVVTGITPGTSNITYTLPTGCTRTVIVTVNPLPASISGTTSVCQGLTTTLTDITAGGAWSSSATGIATIGATTGIATGIATGTTTISYTLPTGCYSTAVLTVNATPASTGVASVCEGATTTLSNTLGGGTWSSGNILVATTSPSTGVVNGITAGTAVITYTFTTGCITTTVVTVNPLPAAIGGTATVCIGLTTTLTDATPGGTWISGSTGIATIGAGTGIVTGAAAGTSNITYTITATGCAITSIVTVNPLPSSITGPTDVCAGSSITLSDASGGGAWSSSNTSVATADAVTGGISGITAGTVTITYTAPVTGCYATTIITVNPIPPAIGGPATVCIGATSTLTDAVTGGTWISGNTAIATIGLSSGIVSGIAQGTTDITYTAPTGCVITRIITVNPLPAAITGSVAFCQGSTITLSDPTTGGAWTSSNTSIATVGFFTGIVTGMSGGTATITYTLPTGCIATTTVTVNPLPAAFGGSASVCLGLTSTLTNTSGGGAWTSSNTAIATVGASSGVVSGIATGTATITYTLATGCIRTITATVNPLPAVITGIAQVCVGLTTTLDNISIGGAWTSSNTAIAVVSAGTGVVTGVAAGTARITYTLPTSCITTTIVTVNPLPFAISGPTGVCLGSSVTLSNFTPSGTWSSSNTSVATIGSSTGIVSGIALGTTTITYRLTTTGCEITRTETVNPLPAGISGPTTVCGGGGTITLSDATPGGTWSSSNTAIATVGASSGIVTGASNGNATITYTLATGCFATISISVNATPPAIITPMGDTTFCPGGFVVLNANTGIGLTYEWYHDGLLIPGAASSTYVASTAGSYQVKVFNSLGCPASSIPMLVTIDVPVAAITAPGGIIGCAGGIITLNANIGTGLSYQWLHDGTPISGATTATYDATVSGVYSVVVTNTTGCSAGDAATVTVNPVPAATITLSGPLTFCQGGSVTMTAPATTGVSYQWYNSFGAIVGGTTNAYTATASGNYSVVATNTFGCSAGSVVSVVVVNPLPSVAIVHASPTIFCAGGNVSLVATSGTGLSYQWYKGGVAISGATNANYLATASGGYRVQITNTTTGCNDITHADTNVIVVNAPVILPLTSATFCWGGSALLGTNVPAMSGVTYQWYRDGVAITGATSPTYNATVPALYTCSISIPASCTVVTTSAAVTERPLPNPIISYNTGTHVLSTQTYFVSYQWYKGLATIPGATSATTIATGNETYKVQVTDTNGCQSFSTGFPVTTWTGGGLAVQDIPAGEVRIYPNPAKDRIRVEASGLVRVVICSIDGRKISEHNAAATHEISISGLANGLYMVTVMDESGNTLKVEKLVKASE